MGAPTAAGLLTDRAWEGQENLPVFGPDHLTPTQMAEVISDALDHEPHQVGAGQDPPVGRSGLAAVSEHDDDGRGLVVDREQRAEAVRIVDDVVACPHEQQLRGGPGSRDRILCA
jgi:hypothetical protein